MCRGAGTRIDDVARRLLERAERPLRIETDPALLRPAEVPVLIGDPARLRAATGFEPEFRLDSTLDAVLARAREGARGDAAREGAREDAAREGG